MYLNFLTTPIFRLKTGHCLRRTAISWAANAGLTLPQIKCLSGHQSDTVVQGYINNSTAMRNIIEESLGFTNDSKQASNSSLIRRPLEQMFDSDLQQETQRSIRTRLFNSPEVERPRALSRGPGPEKGPGLSDYATSSIRPLSVTYQNCTFTGDMKTC